LAVALAYHGLALALTGELSNHAINPASTPTPLIFELRVFPEHQIT
jgi:hypothetical protein